MEDLQIIDLYFARDEQAIRETDAKYGRLCHSIAFNILDDQQDSEECVNDTYMGLWNTIPPVRPGNFRAFVSRIVRNLSLKKLEYLSREKRAKAMTVSLSELETVLPDDRICPQMEDGQIGRHISQFLWEQKEAVRNVFIRKYFFFDSVTDIAKRYGFTESKVKNILYHTRNKLKEYLTKEGVYV